MNATPPCRICAGEGCFEQPASFRDTLADCPHCRGTGECDCRECLSDACEAENERRAS